MEIKTYREPDRRHKVLSIILMLSTALIIIIAGFYILPEWGIVAYFLIIFLTIFLLILWHWTRTAYICQHCSHEFEISFWQDLISAHTFSKKMLKCPACGIRDYATELLKV